ncbi:non-ribosomal peptide synthetase [Streptantibioticus ferralitis]|uniref:Amino acid adenylation domain-containing protein n=1 Tax=Streptantibioticus ferralitis TaxID=236510 RepID=A0ABT5Z8C5_9ACTN|nr:non-ribosomal peptide synthetase [Streptantibioticus ferralitis]MDF2260082.1 amino acid adenylation domain-containing protein [Streptantibioticus ferralitis]
MTDFAARIARLSPEQREALLKRLKDNAPSDNASSNKASSDRASAGIVAAKRTGDTVPLSYAQERIWFLEQFTPGTPFHNMSGVTRIPFPVEPDVFAECVDQVVERHEVLRTRFVLREGAPVGVVAQHVQVPVRVLADLGPQEREQLFLEDARVPFDLSVGPLLRVTVAPGGSDECFVQFTMHHIVSDGFSIAVFFRELGELYRPRLAGMRIELPPLKLQFANVAVAERAKEQDGEFAESVDYWARHLRGAPSHLALPADRRRPARATNRGRRLPVRIPAELVQQVRKLSLERSVTPFVTMLTAFATVLGRYSAQDDLVIGVPVANREMPGAERLIGPFLNTLALRLDLGGPLTFAELLAQVNRTVLAGFEHQAVPLERVLQAVQCVRDPSRSPLFQAVFNFQVDQSRTPGVPDSQLRGLPNGGCQFDLLFDMMATPDGITAHIDYYSDVYDEASVVRFADSFLAVLRAGADEAERPVHELPLLSPQGSAHLIEQALRTTGRAYDRTQCVHELVLASARSHPDRVALVEGSRLITYGELDALSGSIAAALADRAPALPGAHVAICLPRSAETITAIIGVLRAGYAYIPLDPDYPPERTAFVYDDADIAAVVTHGSLLDALPPTVAPVILLDGPLPEGPFQDPVGSDAPERSERCAYTIYTSGSTGLPKGVRVSHRNVVNVLTAIRERPGLTAADTLLAVTSPSFDMSVAEMLLPLVSGARVVVALSEDVVDGRRLAALLDEHRVTVMAATPSTWYLMVESGWRGRPGLRAWSGGEALQPALAETLLRSCDEVWNLYGPTETTVYSTVHRVGPEDVAEGSIPIGRPVANTTAYVLDHGGNPLPYNVLGELCLGGDGVSLGYQRRPELNSAGFVTEPFLPGQRLYRTGDLVRMRPDGELVYAGRRDHQVKIRGVRIELGEIEAVLGSHPQVTRAVAVVEGEAGGTPSIVAYVQPTAEAVTAAQLTDFLRERLVPQLVPGRIVRLAELPLNANGKIDRNALSRNSQEQDGQDRNASAEPGTPTGCLAPRDETEERMAVIWREVLDRPQLGVLDDFFELGGNSLLATKLVFRIREAFGVDLPLQALFESQATVAGLSALATRQATAAEAVPPDLAAEARLADDIRPVPGAHVHSVRHPQHVFLTGATGFIGAFLLARLLQRTDARIFCLVRAASADQGYERIRSTLTGYGIWDPAFGDRIIPVTGTLSSPRLGLNPPQWQHLAAMVDVVYHCGAEVDFLRSYWSLRPANVLGTAEVLRLACDGSTKPVHFVSTTSVFSRPNYPAGTCFTEEMEPVHDLRTTLGYTQTKWVGEQLVREAGRRGLPVYIYRAGRVGGHSSTGASRTGDFVWQLVKVGIELGAAPLLDVRLDVVPVDFVVDAMLHLSRQPELRGTVFHLVQPQPVPQRQLVAWLEEYGYGGERVAFTEWCRRAGELSDETAAVLAPFLSGTLPQGDFVSGGFDRSNADRGLAGSGIGCPLIDDRLLRTYVGYFVETGYLPAPHPLRSTAPQRAVRPN